MHCVHLRLKAEYWNFGKEPSDKTSLRKQIARANGKIMVDADYPDQVVVALHNKEDMKELRKLVTGFYEMTNMTSGLTKEGQKMMEDTLKI